ncbi:unnamed protein product, partial [Mesorhabditis spiculigera]
MGNLARAAALLLALASAATALRCNIGSVTVDAEGTITQNYVTMENCKGVCTRRSPKLPDGTQMHQLGCEEQQRVRNVDDICSEDLCNRIPGLSDGQLDVVDKHRAEVLPVANRTCYVGVQIGSLTVAGAAQHCLGECASATTMIGALNGTIFFCATFGVCDAFVSPPSTGPRSCSPVAGHPDYNITACCCYDSSNCNLDGFNIPTPSPLPPVTRIPQACYSGIHIAGQLLAGGDYVACQGDCSSVTFKYQGTYDFTMYSCDPANICNGLGLTNDCMDIANGTFGGCCCNYDACIDPSANPPRYPNGTRTHIRDCYVGLHLKNFTGDGAPLMLAPERFAKEFEAFYCASDALCYMMDTVGSCSNLTAANMGIEACCCYDGPYCNVNGTDVTVQPPSRPPRPTEIIACLEGLHINSISISERYSGCAGECASVTVASSVAGAPYNATLYTCDPATVCRGLGLINRCGQIPNSPITGCCCDTDMCINPYARKFPNGTNTLHCGIGLAVGTNYTDVYEMDCDGSCASVETQIGGVFMAGFFCAPKTTCEAVGIVNDCFTILGEQGAPHVTACCCDYFNNCNTERGRIHPEPYTPPSTRPPIACYAGLGINDNLFNTSDKYMACRGDCGAITFRTTVAGGDYNVTMFTCDPVSVCPKMGVRNSCRSGPNGTITGCCCDWNDCIDLANRKVKPYPLPKSVNCFVGLGFESTNGTTTYGSSMACDGQCGTVVTDVNGVHSFGYFCSPQSLCSSFDVYNECRTFFLDQAGDWMNVCCCENQDNCNILKQQPNVTVTTPSTPSRRRTPLACYSGLAFMYNGSYSPLTDEDKYMSCFGDCAQVSYASSLGGVSFTATMYTCDPVSLCTSLGMSNQCTNITQSSSGSSSIAGCCCDWNDCINKRNLTINPAPHKDNLQCFVGLQMQSNPQDPTTKTLLGATLPCNGECSVVSTHFNGFDTQAFLCAPQALCDAFDPERMCGNPINFDTSDYLETCCCSRWDNCNLHFHNIPEPPVVPSVQPSWVQPITCYAGVALNGNVLSPDNRYMSCQGDCAQITYTSVLAGSPFNATIFSCDPVTLCMTFRAHNGCQQISNSGSNSSSIQFCCCDFNDCIDKQTFQPKPVPQTVKDNLQCYVGLMMQSNPQNASTRVLLGAEMPCNGECASINTHFNGQDMWAFMCTPPALCNLFDPERHCGLMNMDYDGDYLETCCCGWGDACNLHRHNIPVPSPLPTVSVTTPPLACYAGFAFNGSILSPADRFMSCQGDCAQLTYSSKFFGAAISATIFSCDPVAICSAFKLQNSCTELQNGNVTNTTISACCCNFNDCLDHTTFQPKPQPDTHNHKDNLQCFVGMQTQSNPQNASTRSIVGASMPCNGDCVSVETHFGSYDLWAFICGPEILCDIFDPQRHCGNPLNMDSAGDYLEICCCGDDDNCNVKRHRFPAPNPIPTIDTANTPPLACYAGIALNSTVLSDDNRFMACQGDCARLTYSSSLNGAAFSATIFTCDPVAICKTFGLKNNCNVIQSGSTNTTQMSGCCCDWNDCIDHQTFNVKTVQTTAQQRPGPQAPQAPPHYGQAPPPQQARYPGAAPPPPPSPTYLQRDPSYPPPQAQHRAYPPPRYAAAAPAYPAPLATPPHPAYAPPAYNRPAYEAPPPPAYDPCAQQPPCGYAPVPEPAPLCAPPAACAPPAYEPVPAYGCPCGQAPPPPAPLYAPAAPAPAPVYAPAPPAPLYAPAPAPAPLYAPAPAPAPLYAPPPPVPAPAYAPVPVREPVAYPAYAAPAPVFAAPAPVAVAGPPVYLAPQISPLARLVPAYAPGATVFIGKKRSKPVKVEKKLDN